MPQLKIVVLAHPAVWADSVKELDVAGKKVAGLIENNRDSKSWINLDGEIGTRKGIYILEPFKGSRFMAKIVYERDIKKDYQSVEEILREDDCLPTGREVPSPAPTASKATLFFDLIEGVCYIYTDTMAPPLEIIASILLDFGSDCGFPCSELRYFTWKEELVTTITRIAYDEGFDPYKVRANLETVKVTAEGDFSDNEDWEQIKNSIDIGKWNTIAFVKSKQGRRLVFGMSRRRRNQLSMPYLDGFSNEEMFEEIMEMRRLVEKALGCDIRQYCFPETILAKFFEKELAS